MTSPAAPKNQTPFDDEISLLDTIQFLKDNFKRILFFIILGGFLGSLYGKFASPVYEGSVLVSPALVAGNYIIDTKTILTKLKMNSYYPKETFLACNPTFYKNIDKDKDIDYDMLDIIETSITKDGNLIELKMESSNKETIHACFESIVSIINASQKTTVDYLIESKKTELNLLEAKLKRAEEFHEQLSNIQIKDFKNNEQRILIDIFYTNMAQNILSEITTLLDRISQVRKGLFPEQTKYAGKVLPINVQRKSFPSEKLGLLLGLFLGGMLGFFISLFRNMKMD
jgi:hypothetical protein